MKLSILILTHNRPELYKRCLLSVLKNKPHDVEILVNNDTDDIVEFGEVKYFYEKSNNLSDIYLTLFNESTGEFVWFLEDDDYMMPHFYDNIDFSYDINYINYIMVGTKESDYVKLIRNFKMEESNVNFQLSQILFKRSLVSNFPDNNDLDNDWNLFCHIKEKTDSIKVIKKFMWVQTTDGKDNISFPEYNKDIRW